MVVSHEAETPIDDEYDEEADSDFDADKAEDVEISSSDDEASPANGDKGQKRNTQPRQTEDEIDRLDSGDEETIKDRKGKRKHRSKPGDQDNASDKEDEAWRAKTRAMRAQEKEEKKQKKLANIKASTIDVDKLWEELNKPGPLPPVHVEGNVQDVSPRKEAPQTEVAAQHKGSPPVGEQEEMITIKRRFKFAGEVHTEEKVVPKSSAEARLWLAQQEGKEQSPSADGSMKQRPLRKISRFDPNYHNREAFRTTWLKAGSEEQFKGPKLNVVEKSKMDWAVHVDAEGLKEELDVHAKAKDAYLNRMDFLAEVEQRKESDAKMARLKG